MKTFVKLTSALLLTFGLANASEYKLDNSHTAVGFSVKHLMITNVKGDFKNYDAKIDFGVDQIPALPSFAISSRSAAFASIRSL